MPGDTLTHDRPRFPVHVMEFMREHYPDLATSLANQHFGYTTVEVEQDEL